MLGTLSANELVPVSSCPMNRTIPLLARQLVLMAVIFSVPLAASWCRAASLTVAPSADTYISQHFTGPNGELPDMVIGSQATFSFGATNRGLIRFDVSSIPAGATITSVTLALTVTKSPTGPDSNFHLHRLLRAWDEEQSTWTIRLAPATPWNENGGTAGVDYAAESSGSVHIFGVGGYVVPSSAGLVADVTTWVTDTNSNQGWLIKTEDETIMTTARRFGSRESFSAASLTVEYLPPRPLRIATLQLSAPHF